MPVERKLTLRQIELIVVLLESPHRSAPWRMVRKCYEPRVITRVVNAGYIKLWQDVTGHYLMVSVHEDDLHEVWSQIEKHIR